MKYKRLMEEIEKNWADFRGKLINGDFSYDDIEKAKSDTFFKAFEDVLSMTAKTLTVRLSDIGLMLRGANKKNDLNDYERLIPYPKYAKHNRMNPENRIFLYLATDGGNSKDDEKNVIKTILSELRAAKYSDGFVTIGEFVITDEAKGKKVIDLRDDSMIPSDESDLYSYIIQKINGNAPSEAQEIIGAILSNVYLNLMNSEEIYRPVEGELDEERYAEYVPFHAVANLIEQMGYAGILYRSTVQKDGTNLVLFEKEYARIVGGSMRHVKIDEYL